MFSLDVTGFDGDDDVGDDVCLLFSKMSNERMQFLIQQTFIVDFP